jgi:hypothetical protein
MGFIKLNNVIIINHILNITLVYGFLSNNVIKANSPSLYIKSFCDKNPNLFNTRKSHLITINTNRA